MRTHYQSLGVDPSAPDEVVRAAYKALAMKFHPDRNQGHTQVSTDRFKEIEQAYFVLSDPARRAAYDAGLAHNRAQSEPSPATGAPPPPRSPDPGLIELVRLVVTVQFSHMYPDVDVTRARNVLAKELGRVPVLAELAQRYGAEATSAIADKILSTRKAEIDDFVERMGHGSPCHLCGGPRKDNDPIYEFSLAKGIKKKWGGALAMLAANVVTVPLGVVVGPRGPGLQTTLARCHLVMCSSCANRHKNLFGVVNVTQAECSRHPAWNRLIRAGYNRYFDRVKTSQFK